MQKKRKLSFSSTPTSCAASTTRHKPELKEEKIEEQNNEPILFRSHIQAFHELSNFEMESMEIDGKEWNSVEHYYQAMKHSKDPKYQETIRLAKWPKDAKRLGGVKRPQSFRADWDQVKEDVMLKALRAKFSQSERLKTLLLSTGNRTLHEHTSYDLYWGDGGKSKKGKDRLGILLMQVRQELKEKDTTPSVSVV